MIDDLDSLAHLLFTAKHRSRRQAKRLIREAGGHGGADELNQLLHLIENHPAKQQIYKMADDLAYAHVANLRAIERRRERGDLDHDQWMIAEGAASGRTYILYLCPSESFLAEIFETGDQPYGYDQYPADDGQILSNLLWLDGDAPNKARRDELLAMAREKLRIYDAVLEMDTE